jgi:protein-disulfide isomerase
MEQNIPKKDERELRRESAVFRSKVKKIASIAITIAVLGGLTWLTISGTKNKEVTTVKLTTVVADDYIIGPESAPVTLIEYLDFECEACGAYFPLVKQLEKEFPNDLKVVLRYYPLPGHKNGMTAALAVEAAAQQGKFNEMHDLLFTEQKNWGEKPAPTPAVFEGYAQKIGLDLEKFKQDVASQSVKDRVQRDVDSGTKLGNTGTPSFYLQGEKIQNPRSAEDFKTLIQAAILKAPKPDAPVLGAKVHEHADFAVYLNGEKFDFKSAKYQSSETNPLDPDAHLHDGNADVTHKHRKGVTLEYFFKTLGMKFDNQCFTTDDGKQYCNTADKKLTMYVNGKPNDKFGNYEFTDLDRILITYGDQTGVADQITSVTDLACMYSEKCPERGKAPTENCVGGLGTEC